MFGSRPVCHNKLWLTYVLCASSCRLGRTEGSCDVGENVRDLVAHGEQDDDYHDRDEDQHPNKGCNEPDGDPDSCAGARGGCGAGGYPALAGPSPEPVVRQRRLPLGAVPPPESVG